MALKFAVVPTRAVATVNPASVLGLGLSDWDWAAPSPVLNPRTTLCFLILETAVSQQ